MVLRATVVCFLENQCIGDPWERMIAADVDLRSDESAKSASVKHWRGFSDVELNVMPVVVVPLRYLVRCLSNAMCVAVGLVMNLANLPTAKAMSGLVPSAR